MKRRFFSLALALVFVLSMGVLSGCSKSSSADKNAGSADKPEKKKVVMILKNLVDPFFVSMKEGAEEAAAKNGIDLEVLAPLQAGNNQEQIQQVEQSIAKKVDAVVLVPADSSGIVPACKELNDAKIPIINVNTKILDTAGIQVASFIKADDYSAATLTATKLGEMLGGKGEVIILEGLTASQTSIDLTKGAVDAFAKYPGIKVVAQQSANFDRVTAMNVTQNLLQAHPNLVGIFADNDEMALGAAEAVQQAGKQGKIQIAGINGTSGGIDGIKAGKMALTCNKDPYMQGYTGVETAAKVLKGETVDSKIFIDVKLITKDNVK